ncbi:MAG TPA: hypothetical protein VLF40_06320 [Candidatus Saccharimonadales bacterium]|nr:hypothetical protein [Candidatus Saccharimonadales bacterium]
MSRKHSGSDLGGYKGRHIPGANKPPTFEKQLPGILRILVDAPELPANREAVEITVRRSPLAAPRTALSREAAMHVAPVVHGEHARPVADNQIVQAPDSTGLARHALGPELNQQNWDAWGSREYRALPGVDNAGVGSDPWNGAGLPRQRPH